MAAAGDLMVHRFPQGKAVDAVRWLPPVSAFDRFVVAAAHDADAGVSAVEILSVALFQENEEPNKPSLLPRASWPSTSRISSLTSAKALTKPLPIALSTFAGSLHYLFVDPLEGSVESELSVAADARSFHRGPISALDLQVDGRACVSVGEDGRVNLVSLGETGLENRRVHDSRGLVSYTAVRWGSPAEFATGGLGFGIQWWDQRKPGGFVSQFKGNWTQGSTSGIVHSIDIHPSRKHICIAGGSSGTVFAWDLRWQKQPIILSGIGFKEQAQTSSEKDGMLTVLEQGYSLLFGVGDDSHAYATERFLDNILRIRP
ncbi:hypothetical protein Taro_035908 [Colocasia esculenta]|uniref:Nuclear pore complex protein NUP43 n=1 Tax=Colocasia esculenta TaxID=4460 RepID=A0A843VVV2_COLES|nr:hypothetical protein [Colocasia esculenta]